LGGPAVLLEFASPDLGQCYRSTVLEKRRGIICVSWPVLLGKPISVAVDSPVMVGFATEESWAMFHTYVAGSATTGTGESSGCGFRRP